MKTKQKIIVIGLIVLMMLSTIGMFVGSAQPQQQMQEPIYVYQQ